MHVIYTKNIHAYIILWYDLDGTTVILYTIIINGSYFRRPFSTTYLYNDGLDSQIAL